jgi:hypothetical protein
MGSIVSKNGFSKCTEVFGMLPKFAISRAIHLQEEVHFILEGFPQPYNIFAI